MSILSVGNVELDTDSSEIKIAGVPASFPCSQRELLRLLLLNLGSAVSYQAVSDAPRGRQRGTSDARTAAESRIRFFRKNLKNAGAAGVVITPIHKTIAPRNPGRPPMKIIDGYRLEKSEA